MPDNHNNAHEVKEVNSKISRKELKKYSFQIALRIFDMVDKLSLAVTDETRVAISNAIIENIDEYATPVTPGGSDFNADLYLKAIDVEIFVEALIEVFNLATDQAKDEYEEKTVYSSLLFFLMAFHVESEFVEAEKGAKGRGVNIKQLDKETTQRVKKIRDAFVEWYRKRSGSDNALNALTSYTSIIPRQYSMINNPLMNEIAGATGKKPINAGSHDLTVIPPKGKQPEITTYVTVTDPTTGGIMSNLTEQERSVSDAIMSIYLQATEDGRPASFKADTIYRVMPGRGEKPGEETTAAIVKTIEKFRNMTLEIDATDELRARKAISNNERFYYNEHYINVGTGILKTGNGREANVWTLLSMPLILKYALATKQIITIPANLLAVEKVKNGKPTGEILSMSEQRRAMTSYMIRRIAVMKNDADKAKENLRKYDRRRIKDPTVKEKSLDEFKTQSNVILFDSIFKAAGAEDSSREMMRRNREFCCDVLDFWQAKGYITGYNIQSKGRTIRGIEIII